MCVGNLRDQDRLDDDKEETLKNMPNIFWCAISFIVF